MIEQPRELPLPELFDLTREGLVSEAQYLRVMSLGRPKQEATVILRVAAKISKLSDSLEQLAGK